MRVVLSLLSKSLCGPVGGQEPKDQSACRNSGNATASGSLVGNATAVASMKPSGTGPATSSLPFTGDATVVNFSIVGYVWSIVFWLFMGSLV